MATDKKPRKTTEERIAELEAKAAELRRSMKEKERRSKARRSESDRKRRTNKLIIVGAQVLAVTRENAKFRAAVIQALELASDSNKKKIADLIAELKEENKETPVK